MIRALPRQTAADRRRVRYLARRQWQTRLVLVAIREVEGFGRVLVILERLETRWSDRAGRRLWRRPLP